MFSGRPRVDSIEIRERHCDSKRDRCDAPVPCRATPDFGVSLSACALRRRASVRRHPSSCHQAYPTRVLNLVRAGARSYQAALAPVAAHWATLPVDAIAVAAPALPERAQVSRLAVRAARPERFAAAAPIPTAALVAALDALRAQGPEMAELPPAARPAVAVAAPSSVQAARQAVRVVPRCQVAAAFHVFPEPGRPQQPAGPAAAVPLLAAGQAVRVVEHCPADPAVRVFPEAV